MASPIEQSWVHATILIETQEGSRGTGFLVGRPGGEVDTWRMYLVTNKHVLHKNAAQRAAMSQVQLHINVDKGSGLQAESVIYPLRGTDGSWVREHPDPAVDVLAIVATPLFNNIQGFANKFVPEEMFCTAAKRNELEVSAGEEVVTVGYPNGLRQGRTNLPLIRQGIISTRLGEELHEEQRGQDGQPFIRVTRGFLVDGATIPGSSGSPVVLKPVTGRYQSGNIMLGPAPVLLLGIIAETRFAPIRINDQTEIPSFAGLGLAFDIETIVETLDLFG